MACQAILNSDVLSGNRAGVYLCSQGQWYTDPFEQLASVVLDNTAEFLRPLREELHTVPDGVVG